VVSKVQVAADVLSKLSELIEEHGDRWSLRVTLRTAVDGGVVERALSKSVAEIHAHVQAEDENRSGLAGWDWMKIPDGLLLMLRDDEHGDELLVALADALATCGVEGVIELAAPSTTIHLPLRAPMIGCAIRVSGEREQPGDRGYRWRADQTAHRTVLEAGMDWAEGPTATFKAGTVGWAEAKGRVQAREIVHETSAAGETAAYAGMDEHGYRCVSACTQGVVTLVAGVWKGQTLDWTAAIRSIKSVLRQTSKAAVYANALRGVDVSHFLVTGELSSTDWVQRDVRPVGPGWTARSFVDFVAPDVFGIQLLGRGYADREINSRDWTIEDLGDGVRLVEHVDLAAWFAEPLFGIGRDPGAVPAILRDAREELDVILYQPGRLAARRFPDADN
jgi:hypothetical protein